MAKSSAIVFLLSFSCLLALAKTTVVATNNKYKYNFNKLKQTNIVFYMHDFATGSNVTNTHIVNKPSELLKFGSTVVLDDKLTEAYNWDSPQIGRARGLYTNSNSAVGASADFHLLLSLVFTSREFNGSTLEIQGSDRSLLKYREVSVVSGTGKFRMARGFAVIETAFLDIPNINAVLRWNVTVFHY